MISTGVEGSTSSQPVMTRNSPNTTDIVPIQTAALFAVSCCRTMQIGDSEVDILCEVSACCVSVNCPARESYQSLIDKVYDVVCCVMWFLK